MEGEHVICEVETRLCTQLGCGLSPSSIVMPRRLVFITVVTFLLVDFYDLPYFLVIERKNLPALDLFITNLHMDKYLHPLPAVMLTTPNIQLPS